MKISKTSAITFAVLFMALPSTVGQNLRAKSITRDVPSPFDSSAGLDPNKGQRVLAEREYEESCGRSEQCKPGLSCDASKRKCYHHPRTLGEPCQDSLGGSCENGLTCAAGLCHVQVVPPAVPVESTIGKKALVSRHHPEWKLVKSCVESTECQGNICNNINDLCRGTGSCMQLEASPWFECVCPDGEEHGADATQCETPKPGKTLQEPKPARVPENPRTLRIENCPNDFICPSGTHCIIKKNGDPQCICPQTGHAAIAGVSCQVLDDFDAPLPSSDDEGCDPDEVGCGANAQCFVHDGEALCECTGVGPVPRGQACDPSLSNDDLSTHGTMGEEKEVRDEEEEDVRRGLGSVRGQEKEEYRGLFEVEHTMLPTDSSTIKTVTDFPTSARHTDSPTWSASHMYQPTYSHSNNVHPTTPITQSPTEKAVNGPPASSQTGSVTTSPPTATDSPTSRLTDEPTTAGPSLSPSAKSPRTGAPSLSTTETITVSPTEEGAGNGSGSPAPQIPSSETESPTTATGILSTESPTSKMTHAPTSFSTAGSTGTIGSPDDNSSPESPTTGPSAPFSTPESLTVSPTMSGLFTDGPTNGSHLDTDAPATTTPASPGPIMGLPGTGSPTSPNSLVDTASPSTGIPNTESPVTTVAPSSSSSSSLTTGSPTSSSPPTETSETGAPTSSERVTSSPSTVSSGTSAPSASESAVVAASPVATDIPTSLSPLPVNSPTVSVESPTTPSSTNAPTSMSPLPTDSPTPSASPVASPTDTSSTNAPTSSSPSPLPVNSPTPTADSPVALPADPSSGSTPLMSPVDAHPTGAPLLSEGCTDWTGWVDSYGDGCEWYEGYDLSGCPAYGHKYEPFDSDGDSLGLPNEACCHCGGGKSCSDTANWVDSYGDGCDWYEEYDLPGCPKYGELYEGTMGKPKQGCCYCAGGVQIDLQSDPPFTVIFISDMETLYRGNKMDYCSNIITYIKDFGSLGIRFDDHPGFTVDPELVIHGGDISDSTYHWSNGGLEFGSRVSSDYLFDEVYQQLYDSGIPFMSILGNHDLEPGTKTGDGEAVKFVKESFVKAAQTSSDFTYEEIPRDSSTYNSMYVANYRGLQIATANDKLEGTGNQWMRFQDELDNSKPALFFSHRPLDAHDHAGNYAWRDFIGTFPNPQHYAGHTHRYSKRVLNGVTTHVAPYPHRWDNQTPGFLALLVSPSQGVLETKKISYNYEDVSGCWEDGTICLQGTTCGWCCNEALDALGTQCGGSKWADGTLCGAGTTCKNCQNSYEYWYSKAFTACGTEPKWQDGTHCGIGTTCNQCQNPYSYWYSKAFTACGSEPKWSDGTICGAGSTCNQCKNGYEYWYSKAFTACGKEPCWPDNSICGAGTTCNQCCNKAYNALGTRCGGSCWSDGTLCGIGTTCDLCCDGHEYWDSKLFTACGDEPCWGHGSHCGAGTTCNNCCNGYSWHWNIFFTACD